MKPDPTVTALGENSGANRPRRSNSQPLHAVQIADALLTLRTASAVAGISPATIYRRASTDPTFPRLIRMGRRCTRIRAGDLTAWLASKAEAA
jgi:predicted DNA-binding transcriptional regulator AlpA